MPGLSPAVRGLLIANVVLFLAGLLLPGWDARLIKWLAFWFPRHENFAVWQIVTYMFMHGSIGHIFFNMFGLVSFGLLLEQQWGTRRFLVFYFMCGIGAGLIHSGISYIEYHALQNRLNEAGVTSSAIEAILETGRYRGPPELKKSAEDLYRIYAGPMLGASGAIYGILVAFGLLYPNAKLAILFIPVPVAAKYVIPVLLALDLFSGVTGFSLFGGGIAHFAHLGGALIGFLLMWHWRNQARRAAELGGLRWRE